MNSCWEKRKCFKNLCGDYQVLCRSGAGSKLASLEFREVLSEPQGTSAFGYQGDYGRCV